MDESRKRNRDPGPSISDTKRRKNESVAAETEVSQPADVNVLRHQNKHMFLRLKEKDRAISALERELETVRLTQKEQSQHVSIIDRFWARLNNDLHGVQKRVEPLKQADVPSSSVGPSPLLRLFTSMSKKQRSQRTLDGAESKLDNGFGGETIPATPEERYKLLEHQAEQHCTASLHLVTALLQAVEQQASSNHTLMAQLKGKISDEALRKQYEALAKTQEERQQQLEELETKCREQTEDIASFEERMTQLQNDKYACVLEAEDTRVALQMAMRRLDRQQFDGGLSPFGSASSLSSLASSAKGSDAPPTSEDALEWKQRASFRTRELEVVRSEKLAIEAQLHAKMATEINPSSQEAVQKSRWYMALQRECQAAKETVAAQTERVEQLQRQLQSCTNDRGKEQQQFMATTKEARLQFEKDVIESESKAERYRAQLVATTKERDELKLKALDVKDPLSSLKELDTVVQKQQREIDTLKDELKLRGPVDKEASERHLMFKKLKGMEKTWQTRERELSVQLNAFQTASKDVKELVKTVREQELALVELKQKYERATRAVTNEALQQAKDEYEQKSEELQTMSEAMGEELDNLAKSQQDAQEENVRLVTQLAGRDQTLQQLTSERLQVAQQISALTLEKESVTQRLFATQEKAKALAATVSALESKAKQLGEEAQLLRTKCAQLELQVDAVSTKAKQEHVAMEEFRDTSQLLSKRLQELAKRADQQSQQLELRQAEISSLKEDLDGAERKQQDHEPVDKDTLVELKYMKGKVQCNVCSDREKNCVLRCGHCFCRQCIDTIVKQRHRKCPGCSKTFGEKEVLDIFLT